MKYGNLTLGQIESLINKIGGENAVRSVLKDELILSKTFPTWETVIVGGNPGDTPPLKCFINFGFQYTENAEFYFDEIYCSGEEQYLDLVLVSGYQLGFTDDKNTRYSGATLEEIFKTASTFGLFPCPTEVVPALFLQKAARCIGVTAQIATKPLRKQGNSYGQFNINSPKKTGSISDIVLSAKIAEGSDPVKWGHNVQWVFARK
jgi:hypothetical protein